MKKYFIASLIVVFVFGVSAYPALAAESTAYTNAQTSITQITSVQELKALLKFLKKQVKILKKSLKNKSDDTPSATGENLSISSMTVAYPEIGGATTGVMDQKLSVVVKNNQYGSASLSYKKFKYAVYLYEVVGGEKDKLMKAATGEAYIPYANGSSSFDVVFEGGRPFDGEDYERTFVAEVKIDTEDDVNESNEKDNSAWSNTWLYTYYKG